MPDLPVPESKIRFLINSCMIHKTIEITFPFKAIFIKNNAAATVAKDMKKNHYLDQRQRNWPSSEAK